ncbi:MAG: adenylosuccinate synthase [Chloroflexota bacterium]
MSVTVVVGAQWGDEGKGKVVDLLAGGSDLVMRFQGGSNAGHTVINDFGEFALHLLPSGIFNPACTCVLGAGTVVDPPALLGEIATVTAKGIQLPPLYISNRAHVVMPYHRLFDRLEDEERGRFRVDTTGRGIGPAYTDKIGRIGIRVGELTQEAVLRDKLAIVLGRRNAILSKVYGAETFDEGQVLADCLEWGRRLQPYVLDTVPLVRAALRDGKRILLEGQLSAMKDIDWGSYPYVTSSSPTAGGAAVGAGIPPRAIDRVIGVAKAYSTQVGTGPMPAEISGEQAEYLRRLGGEFGATTGRPRRIGWFDVVVTRYVAELNGFTQLALTKLDLLDTLDEIPVCIAYRVQGERLDDIPDEETHARCEPIYQVLPGWKTSTAQARSLADLPANARAYIDLITEQVGAPLHSIGLGPHRDQTIVL